MVQTVMTRNGSCHFSFAVILAEVNGNRTHKQNTNNANELQQSAIPSGAESGAVGARIPTVDADLAALIDRWPALPEAVRRGIMAMVRQ